MLIFDTQTQAVAQPLIDAVTKWTQVAQALVGSIGALAFILAFIWKMVAVDSRSVTQAKQWIQRIVIGTIGVELAATLVQVITDSVPKHQS